MEEEVAVVNEVLNKLSEEPVCEETKRELLASYLRENALATLRCLPNDAFMINCNHPLEGKEEEMELMASIKGLSEKESVLYAVNCKNNHKKNNHKKNNYNKNKEGRKDRTRMSLKMSGAKRMSELPNFTTTQPKVNECGNIQIQTSPLPLLVIEEDQTKDKTQKHDKKEIREVIDSVWDMLSQISADSCQNELSSASSEFFPTPPSSHYHY